MLQAARPVLILPNVVGSSGRMRGGLSLAPRRRLGGPKSPYWLSSGFALPPRAELVKAQQRDADGSLAYTFELKGAHRSLELLAGP